MLSLYHISSHKLVKLTWVDSVFFLIYYFLILSFAIELLTIERVLLNIILKKNWHRQCTSQRVMTFMPFRWHMRSLFGYQKLAFVVMLGAACRPLSNNVAHVDRGGLVGPRWSFFSSSLLSLIPLKFKLDLQKNNCVLRFVIWSILTFFLLIIVYLVFVVSSSIFFNFIPGHFIQFYFLIQFGPSTFDCSISVFYIFFFWLLLFFLAILSLPILLHFFFIILFLS
jgi:hypothetical protein